MIKVITRKYDRINYQSEKDYLDALNSLSTFNIEISTTQECFDWVVDKSIIQIDTETVKNFNDFSGHVFTFQVGDFDTQWVIDVTYEENIELCKYILKTDKIKILQNAKYDLKWFLKWEIVPTNIYDTMLAEIVLHTGYRIGEIGVSLDKLGMRYVNTNISKAIRGQINYLGLVPEVIDYAAGDVKYLEEIRRQQLEKAQKQDLLNVIDLENRVVPVFAEMEYNGIYLDKDEWIKLEKEYIKELIQDEISLNIYIANHPVSQYYTIQKDLFEGDKIVGFNFNSSQQIVVLLNNIGKVKKNKELQKLTTANEKEIERYKYVDDFIELYLNYKEKKTNISKYGSKFLRAINPNTNKVHTNYWQILNTGRISSGEKDNPLCPNMQNIPRYSEDGEPGTTKHRGCFKSKEGFSFVSLDFSSQELVLIAEDSKEPVWIEALQKDYDLHSFTAEIVYKQKWKDVAEENCAYYNNNKQRCKCKGHKTMRNNIKTVNYGLTYGAGYNKVAGLLKIPPNSAKALIDEYFSKMSALKVHFNTLGIYGQKELQIRTFKPIRRARYFYPPNDDNEMDSIRRQAMNTRFQGTGADMMKLALIDLYNYLKPKYGNDCLFVLQVHDQVVLEVKNEFAEEIKIKAIEIMRNVSKVMLKILIVNVEGEISKVWKH